MEVLSEPGIRLRSVTLAVDTVAIAYSKQTPMVQCNGMMGIDRNLNNITAADSLGNILFQDLSRITMVKSASRQTIARFKRDDSRIRRRIAGKYGRIEKNRTQWIFHNATKKLVSHATRNHLGIVLEKITGIRRLYHRGNGQSRYYHARLNSWSYYELERQVFYKASWNGLRVIHVNPKGTSGKCSVCGDQMVFSKESRTLHCSTCGYAVDRDVNAACNILSAGLRFSLKGLSDEAMKGNPMTTVISRVDDSQSSLVTEDSTEP